MGFLRKVGKKIGRGIRKIGRAIKKGFGKLTKAFGKLGPIGHIAMSLILPGMGGVLGSWMKSFGSNVLKFLPKGFANVLGGIGRAVANGASTMYNNTVGVLHKTITGGLEWGLNKISNIAGVPEGMGLGDKFSNFVDSLNEKISSFKPTTEYTVVEGDTLSTIADKTGISLDELKSINPKLGDPNLIKTGQNINIKGYMPSVKPDDSPIEQLKKKEIGGTTVGEIYETGKDVTNVVGTINSLTSDDNEVDSPFYNRNISQAEDLLYTPSYDTITGNNVNFVNLTPHNNFGSLVHQYLDGNGIQVAPQDRLNAFQTMSPIGYDPFMYASGGYGK